jgi:hypothetical protein
MKNQSLIIENSVNIEDEVISLKIPKKMVNSFKFKQNGAIVCTVVDGAICISNNPKLKILPPVVLK